MYSSVIFIVNSLVFNITCRTKAKEMSTNKSYAHGMAKMVFEPKIPPKKYVHRLECLVYYGNIEPNSITKSNSLHSLMNFEWHETQVFPSSGI